MENMGNRDRDLMGSAPFADFVAKELVPWVRGRYRISPDPSRAIVCGSSAGGLCAAYCGLRHPDVFGNVLSQSGAFAYAPGSSGRFPTYASETGWLTRQFVKSPKLPLRFYLDVGRFDRNFGDNLLENRRLRDVLEAKGYPVTYAEYDGGHDYLSWQGSLADGVIALLGERAAP